MDQKSTSKVLTAKVLKALASSLFFFLLGAASLYLLIDFDFLKISYEGNLDVYVAILSMPLILTMLFDFLFSSSMKSLKASMKSLKQSGMFRQVQELGSISSDIRNSIEVILTSEQNAATVAQFDSELSHILSQLETMRESIDSFISSNSSDRLSTEYDSYAKREKQTAIVYDVVAIMLAVSGAAVAFISSFNDSSLGAWSLVTRATMAIGTFTASGFVFRRGTFHHREAKAAMRTALSLSQYRAFTANLPDDIKDQIEIDIAERVFSKGEIDHTEDRLVDIFSRRGMSISELSDLIKLLRETGTS